MDGLVQAGEHVRISLSVHARTEQDAVKAMEALSRLAAGFTFEGMWAMLSLKREKDDEG